MANEADIARLSLPRVWAFSVASLPIAMIGLMLATYLPRFYAGHVGLDLATLGLAIAAIRLVDVGLDLLLGWLMDRTKTPVGRFRPWLTLAAPVVAFAVYRLFDPPPDADIAYLVGWLLVLYAGFSAAALSHSAWGARLCPDYHERSRLFGWVQGIAVLGSVALLLLPALTRGAIRLGAAESMPAVAAILALAALVLIPLSAVLTPEPSSRRPLAAAAGARSRTGGVFSPNMLRLAAADLLLTLGAGATAPLYIFFFHDAKGFSLDRISLLLIPFVGAGLIGAPVWARLARELGKPRTVQVAAVAYAIAQSVLMALPQRAFGLTFAGMFAVGFAASAFVVLIRAMVGDVADEVRLTTNRDQLSLLYALVILTQKVGSSLTASVVLPILAAVGYDAREGAVNTARAIAGLEACYLFAPILLVLAGGAVLFGYGLTPEVHAAIRSALSAREKGVDETEGPQPAGLNLAAE